MHFLRGQQNRNWWIAMIASRQSALILATCIFCLCGCSRDSDQGYLHSSALVPPPPSVGNVNKFEFCKARPEKPLSASEKCQIKKLSARCLPADDCMIQCISSRDGQSVGGGCEHVCFSGAYVQPPLPPDWKACFGVQTRDVPLGK